MPDVLGVVSGLITIYAFMESLFPGASETSSSMRLAVGLNSGAGGNVPRVLVYNANYENIGGYNPNNRHCQSNGWGSTVCYDRFEKVGEGQFVDLPIYQSVNQQPVYVKLEQPDNDGICLAYITHTWADGHKYGWVGDWGAHCGADWYESQIIVDDKGTTTKCVWLDKDKSDGEGNLGLHMWLPAFSPGFNKDGKELSADWYCNRNHIMQFYDSPDATHYMWAPGTPWGPQSSRSRSLDLVLNVNQTVSVRAAPPGRPRSQAIATELIVSNNTAHSAARLCQSPTSFGPDFVSIPEQLVCDMGSHTIWPLCSPELSGDCFDMGKKTLKSNSPEQREQVTIYEKITEWN